LSLTIAAETAVTPPQIITSVGGDSKGEEETAGRSRGHVFPLHHVQDGRTRGERERREPLIHESDWLRVALRVMNFAPWDFATRERSRDSERDNEIILYAGAPLAAITTGSLR